MKLVACEILLPFPGTPSESPPERAPNPIYFKGINFINGGFRQRFWCKIVSRKKIIQKSETLTRIAENHGVLRREAKPKS